MRQPLQSKKDSLIYNLKIDKKDKNSGYHLSVLLLKILCFPLIATLH